MFRDVYSTFHFHCWHRKSAHTNTRVLCRFHRSGHTTFQWCFLHKNSHHLISSGNRAMYMPCHHYQCKHTMRTCIRYIFAMIFKSKANAFLLLMIACNICSPHSAYSLYTVWHRFSISSPCFSCETNTKQKQTHTRRRAPASTTNRPNSCIQLLHIFRRLHKFDRIKMPNTYCECSRVFVQQQSAWA